MHATDCCPNAANTPRAPSGSVAALIVAAALPKCPACLMAYGSVLALTPVSETLTSPWLAALLAISALAAAARYSLRARDPVLVVTCAASILVLIVGRWTELPWATGVGVAVLVLGHIEAARRRRRPAALARPGNESMRPTREVEPREEEEGK